MDKTAFLKCKSRTKNGEERLIIIMSEHVNGNVKKYVYRVEINTMADAKALVSISSKLQGQITLQSGNKFAVNAKSLLGVLLAKQLNWSDLRIVMDNDYYHEYDRFIVS